MIDQSCRSYLKAQQNAGHKVVVALPVLYPREVLTALDLCAVECWSFPQEQGCSCTTPLAMQSQLCPMVRGAHALLHKGLEGAIAAVVPHTCDSLQGLGMIALEPGASAMPVVTFRLPRGGDRTSARAFLRSELQGFIASLERLCGSSLAIDRLAQAVALHEQIDAIVRNLLRDRAYLTVSDPALYGLLRKREWMRPEDFLAEIAPLQNECSTKTKRSGIPLLVSGMVPEPKDLLDAIEAAGAYIAVDDFAAIGRRLPLHPVERGDPLQQIASRLTSTAPCPTRCANPWARVRYLVERAKDAGVRGVLLHTVKSCEPELFEVPILRHGLQEAGLKVLHSETEFEPRASAQLVTRIEAFLEMLGA